MRRWLSMQHEEMAQLAAALVVGDKVIVREAGGRDTPYTVTKISSKKAREVTLIGRCKAVRVLVGTNPMWLRHPATPKRERSVHRLVVSLRREDRALMQALRDAEFAARRLPPGYTIKTDTSDNGAIQHAAMFGSMRVMPDSIARQDPLLAVIDAWAAYGDRLSRMRAEDIDQDTRIQEHLRESVNVFQSDMLRCRRVLQQISEMIAGKPPSGACLNTDISPEQVAADVGHCLILNKR